MSDKPALKVVSLPGAANPQAFFAELLERAGDISAAVVFYYDKAGFFQATQIGLDNRDMALIALRAGDWALFPD